MSLYLTVIPRPSVGDVFIRYRDNGEYEEALVVAVVVRSENDWKATLVCASGHDFLGGSPERRAFESWFPKGWVYDTSTASFRPPNTKWDGERMRFVEADLDESPKAQAKPGDPAGTLAPPVRPVAGLDNIPVPNDGEHFMTWSGRCRRMNPEVNFDDPAVKAFLSERWTARRPSAPPPAA